MPWKNDALENDALETMPWKRCPGFEMTPWTLRQARERMKEIARLL